MRRTSFDHMSCSIAQTLEVIGDWWTPLIIRDALMGVSRFEDLHQRLGIARNVLTQRLQALTEHGILEAVAYQERPTRYDYRLTERGHDLWHAMAALRQWGDRWTATNGAPVDTIHTVCGDVTTIEPACSSCGAIVKETELRLVPGPGARDDDPILPVRGRASADPC